MPEIKIYLASQSPRRRELLNQIGVGYKIVDVTVNEDQLDSESPEQYVTRLALEKARQGWMSSKQKQMPVLGADTCIVQAGAVMGKPVDEQHALDMLAALSGNQHEALTAVALVGEPDAGPRKGEYYEKVMVNCSSVSFRGTSELERKWYWNTGEPAGKAGAYAIQGLGAIFIDKITGSYSGIMGLPLYELAQLLSEFGIEIASSTSNRN